MPLSHPFVERLIGTIRHEYLDQILFWNSADLEAKLIDFQHYYNVHRAYARLNGRLPGSEVDPPATPINLGSYRWQKHSRVVSDANRRMKL